MHSCTKPHSQPLGEAQEKKADRKGGERERERETLKKKMKEYVVPEYRSELLSVFQFL